MFSNMFIKLLINFKENKKEREGMLSRCAKRSELAVTLTSHSWLWSLCLEMCFYLVLLFCQLSNSSVCKYLIHIKKKITEYSPQNHVTIVTL